MLIQTAKQLVSKLNMIKKRATQVVIIILGFFKKHSDFIKNIIISGLLIKIIGGGVISNYINDKYNEKKIIYSVEKIKKFHKNELYNFVNNYNIGEFNLNFDDDIIEDYFIIHSKLQNNKNTIGESVRLSIKIGDFGSKILDIKYKEFEKNNKKIKITNSLKNNEFKWFFPKESKTPYQLGWTIDFDTNYELDGFNIYRSNLKDSGFGKVNSEIIKSQLWKISEKPNYRLDNVYYRATVLSKNGEESPLGNVFPVGNISPFYSFEKIEKNIVNNTEKNSNIQLDTQKEIDINTVDITMPNGIGSGSGVDIYILCKTLPGIYVTHDVKLIDNLSVNLEVNIKENIFSPEKLEHFADDAKIKSTVKAIRSYSSDNEVYFIFDVGDVNLDKVRVFRSIERASGDFSNVGDEIYNGKILYDYKSLFIENSNYNSELTKNINNDDNLKYLEPPDNKSEKLTKEKSKTLDAPTLFKIYKGIPLTNGYFVDKNLADDRSYSYTFYTYDKNGIIGCPILVNAKLSKITKIKVY